MEHLRIGLGESCVVRLFSRNPLVRTSDRLEGLTVLLALVAVLLLSPMVGAVGTALHDSHSRAYVQQSLTRHLVPAVAQEDTASVVHRTGVSYRVWARWNTAGSDHLGLVRWPSSAKAGSKSDVWVDETGANTTAPVPVRQAAVEAAAIAVILWSAIAAAAAGTIYAVRSRLDRARHAAWDREFAAVVDGRGGRTPHTFDS